MSHKVLCPAQSLDSTGAKLFFFFPSLLQSEQRRFIKPATSGLISGPKLQHLGLVVVVGGRVCASTFCLEWKSFWIGTTARKEFQICALLPPGECPQETTASRRLCVHTSTANKQLS